MPHKNGHQPSSSTRNKTRARLKAIGSPCHICGRPIDYDLDWYTDPRDGKCKRHPWSFEWDHDKPKSQGGTDAWENAKPAHRICNQLKGDGRKRRGSNRVNARETQRERSGDVLQSETCPNASDIRTSRTW